MKKEEIENEIEKLKLKISDEEIKLKFINEVGIDNFDENQFKAYKVLQTIKLDLSDFDKSKLIADLMVKPIVDSTVKPITDSMVKPIADSINVKPSEPSKYPKELVDLWNILTKNIVVEHRGSDTFFYDTIKNEVIMLNRKQVLWGIFGNESYLACNEVYMRPFISIIGSRDNDVEEFIKCMIWDTFKLSVYEPYIEDLFYLNKISEWKNFKLKGASSRRYGDAFKY